VVVLSKIGSAFKWLIDYLLGYPSKEVAERNERLFQTYLIVFGLLLACNFDDPLHKELVKWFVSVIGVGLLYYLMLSRFQISRFFSNFLSLYMGTLFSYAIVQCLSYSGIETNGNLLFLFLAIVTIASLFV
jgi:hypothetical protein